MKKNNLDQSATKKDLSSLEFRLESKIEDSQEETREENRKFKSEILDAIDGVMGEITAMREEQAAHGMSHDRIQSTLNSHGERITTLER